jgi:hypothetical protein
VGPRRQGAAAGYSSGSGYLFVMPGPGIHQKKRSIRGDGIAGWGFPFPSGSATKQSNDDGNDDPDYSRPGCDLGPEQCAGSCFLLLLGALSFDLS